MTSSSQEPSSPAAVRLLCATCIGDQFLRAEVETSGCPGACSYCHRDGTVCAIDQVSDSVEQAISDHFLLTSWPGDDAPAVSNENPSDDTDDIAGPSAPGVPLLEVIRNAACVDESIAEDLLRPLADRHSSDPDDPLAGTFEKDALYVPHNPLGEGHWIRFEESIKTVARFFNPEAGEILARMFHDIDSHGPSYGRVVVDAGPGTELSVFYRARKFQAETVLREAMAHPDRELGPPPSRIASAGRMNPAGIAVFYGATDAKVALAEVQPPVGSKVLIARFQVLRPLRLLDIEALERVAEDAGSVFDPDYIRRLDRSAFLRILSNRMSRPVMPNDRELDYLPTQAIADFLANANDPRLDGILYPSVQAGFPSRRPVFGGGVKPRNVVLFPHAADVQPLPRPDGATVSARDDSWVSFDFLDFPLGSCPEHWNLDYCVLVEAPEPPAEAIETDATLQLLDPLELHEVLAIRVDTRPRPVHRYHSPRPRLEPES